MYLKINKKLTLKFVRLLFEIKISKIKNYLLQLKNPLELFQNSLRK